MKAINQIERYARESWGIERRKITGEKKYNDTPKGVLGAES